MQGPLLSLALVTLAGSAMAISGGYLYHKKQKAGLDNTAQGKISMLGAVYLMSFGAILAIAGLFFLHGLLLTGEVPLTT